jgi:cysteine desulfurase / selenocysteine lyase
MLLNEGGRMKSPEEVKKDIPFLNQYSFWESTAVGPTLKPAIEAMVDYYYHRPFNFLVGDCQPALQANAQVRKATESIAKLVHADPEEISLYPKNATEAIAMVIQGLSLKKGDEIIGSNVDHSAAYIPILRLMHQKGIKFQMIKADPQGGVDLQEYKKRLTKKTKFISICHASNIYGTILDAKAICALARENGVLTMLDAAQTVGRMPVNVKEIGCDFLTICGRKHLCGPQGTAALYVRKELIDKLEPIITGGGAAKLMGDFEYQLLPGMMRHNAGILNTSGVIGLGVAVDYWQDIGMETIRRHCVEMQERIFQGIEELGSIIYSPREKERQTGIISFLINGVDPDFLIRELEEKYRIIIRSGSPGSPVFKELGVNKINRVAPHYYSTKGDVAQLLRAMKEVRDKARS